MLLYSTKPKRTGKHNNISNKTDPARPRVPKAAPNQRYMFQSNQHGPSNITQPNSMQRNPTTSNPRPNPIRKSAREKRRKQQGTRERLFARRDASKSKRTPPNDTHERTRICSFSEYCREPRQWSMVVLFLSSIFKITMILFFRMACVYRRILLLKGK